MSTPEDRSTEEIEREIAETREQLGETAEAIAAKTDVKARAQDKVDDVKSSIRDKKDEAFSKVRDASPEGAQAGAQQAATKAQENPVPIAIAGAFALGIVVGLALRRG